MCVCVEGVCCCQEVEEGGLIGGREGVSYALIVPQQLNFYFYLNEVTLLDLN